MSLTVDDVTGWCNIVKLCAKDLNVSYVTRKQFNDWCRTRGERIFPSKGRVGPRLEYTWLGICKLAGLDDSYY